MQISMVMKPETIAKPANQAQIRTMKVVSTINGLLYFILILINSYTEACTVGR